MSGRYVVSSELVQQLNELLRWKRSLQPQRAFQQRRQRFTHYPSGIAFFNNSGETIPAFGVMKIYSELTLSDSQGVTSALYAVTKPDTSFARWYLVNGSDTVAANGYGTGSFCDIGDRVLYDSADGTPTVGQVWGPYPSSWKLRRHMYGFRIEGDANTSSTHVKCVQHWVTHVFGKTNGAYSKGATTGALSVWKGDASADSTADISSVYLPYAAASSGKWGEVVWHSETPRFTALECS